MARATFYYHLRQLKQPDKYESLREQIKAIFQTNKGRYGYRRITLELRNQAIIINHKTVERLMRECGLKSQVRLKKYRSYKGTAGKIALNVLERDFNANAPNKKWVTDVTEFALFGQKKYLSPILDLYNGEIIAYTISDHPNLNMVTSMLKKAFKDVKRGSGLMLHSDQGGIINMQFIKRY